MTLRAAALAVCLLTSTGCLLTIDESRIGEPLPVGSSEQECLQPKAEWVFCSGFEEGNKNLWDDFDANPDETNRITEDPGPRDAANNHVMLLRPSGGLDTDLVKVLPGDHDALYARWYVRWDAGLAFDSFAHSVGFHSGTRSLLGNADSRPTGDDWAAARIGRTSADKPLLARSHYAGMYQDCADPQSSCYQDMYPCVADEGELYCTKPEHRDTTPPTIVEAERWYCVELQLALGWPSASDADADGSLGYWVDGEPYGPWSDLWLRSSAELGITILWLNMPNGGQDSATGIRFDDIVVSTERIGCHP